jgi:hypothetical protein
MEMLVDTADEKERPVKSVGLKGSIHNQDGSIPFQIIHHVRRHVQHTVEFIGHFLIQGELSIRPLVLRHLLQQPLKQLLKVLRRMGNLCAFLALIKKVMESGGLKCAVMNSLHIPLHTRLTGEVAFQHDCDEGSNCTADVVKGIVVDLGSDRGDRIVTCVREEAFCSKAVVGLT